MTCAVEGCDRPSRARGWCNKHWQRWRRNGHPTAVPERKTRSDAAGHGTRRMYDDYGCRCRTCTWSASVYYHQWKNNGPTRVPVEPVVEHIDALVADGWNYRQISDEAGVGESTPWHLRSGRQKQVNRRTAEQILDLPLSQERNWLPVGPLQEALEGAGKPLRHMLNGNDLRAWYRAVEVGRVSELLADRVAIRALGMPVDVIYQTEGHHGTAVH